MPGVPTASRASTRVLATSATVVALLAGLLTGCSGEDEPRAATSSAPTPTSTLTATPSPTASVDPRDVRPVAPAARNTPEGRKAFARFVVASWGYALRSNDASAVTELGPKRPCQGCRDLQAELARRKRQGWHVDFPGAELRSLKVTTQDKAEKVYVATARVDLPASRSYYDDGSFRNENPAHDNRRFTVRMRFQDKRFVLLEFRLR